MVKTKRCEVAGCQSLIPSFMLMCQPHWLAVPSGLRLRVQNAYRDGREMRIHPTQQYLDARRAALGVVNMKQQNTAAREGDRQAGLALT